MSNQNTNELSHHGIIGQKWGVRRYQNKDGSLTPAGRRREAKLDRQMAKQAHKYNELKRKKLTGDNQENKPKTVKEMSDAELQAKINRLRNEQTLASLQPKYVSKGRRIYESTRDDVIVPAAKDAGKRLLTDYLTKVGKDVLDLNPKADPTAKLKKDVETLQLQKRKVEIEDYFNNRNKKKN